MNALIACVGVFALFSSANGMFWDDFRCTFGLDHEKSFIRIPRTAEDAIRAGYYPEGTTSDDDCDAGPFRGHRYISDDPSLAVLFDNNGIVCGLTAHVPRRDVDIPCNPYHFDKVPMFQPIVMKGEEYYALTFYVVPPKNICKKGRTVKDLMIEGTGTGLWYQNGPTADHLIYVPMQREAALNQGWSDNKCFPGMGRHSLWQTDKYEEHNCTEIRPAILLYDAYTHRLHGAGFTVVGPITSCPRFENPPAEVVNIIYAPTPDCLKKVSANCGAATLHCYFIDKPWEITCPKEDS